MPCQDKHFCPARNERVSTKEGIVKCIQDHECFSDDSCPLQDKFDQHAKVRECQTVEQKSSEHRSSI
jgi:hypothetical protein